ncbi:FAD:protein FMN transferase [Dactylosporangium cerinum]|uniref:FAD:protein FMN transferase n=1 Tax=Dactylosporangium cerinum TaxID=1434730 RepID=A0ABV9WJF3_9ACTN
MMEDEMDQGSRRSATVRDNATARKRPHARSTGAAKAHVLRLERSGAQWPVWNTTLQLVVTSRDQLADAQRLVIDQVAAIDDACNPFRPDSEVRMLQQARGRQVRVSPLLAELVAVSIRAAVISDGDLDPLYDPLYDDVLQERDGDLLWMRPRIGTADLHSPSVPGWRRIRRDGRRLTVPAGALLDLSAMAAAHAVDRCARLIHRRFNVGVRVDIGGDVACAGQPPSAGWETLLRTGEAGPNIPAEVGPTPFAVARSVGHRWPGGGGKPAGYTFHPSTSRVTVSVWRSVSVAAFPCTHAKALSMSAMMRGHAATGWLHRLGASARLVAANGEVITVGRWPAHEAGCWTTR